MFRILWLSLWVLAAPVAYAAEQDATAGGGAGEVHYVPLKPSFVTNFGAPDDGRLYFVRADVSVRVADRDGIQAAVYHLPALRSTLVLLLARQDEASVSTSGGRDAIRAEALAEMRAILEAEEGEPYIEDVLFTNFIVQR